VRQCIEVKGSIEDPLTITDARNLTISRNCPAAFAPHALSVMLTLI